MEIKIVLFDADGVTFRSDGLFSDALAQDYGISPVVTTPFFNGVVKKCMLGTADTKKELLNVIQSWGWNGSVDELLEYWFSTGGEVDKQIVSLAQDLRSQGVHCFMATNQEKYRGEYLRTTLGQGKIFEDIFISAELGHKKNEPEFFIAVFQKVYSLVSGNKSKVLLIDDDQDNITCAKAFGFQAILYTTFSDVKYLLS